MHQFVGVFFMHHFIVSSFLNSWQVSDGLHQFHWQAVCIHTTHCHFSLFTAGKSVTVYTNFTGKQFEADMDGSYMCNSDETLSLNDNVKMETWDLQYFAFENRTDFSDDSMYTVMILSFWTDLSEQIVQTQIRLLL